MDIMEKVEQLRAKANITYEEAKAVLDETNGDMLDAVILLEQRGKIKRPETEVAIKSNDEDASEQSGATDQDATKKKASNNTKVKTTMNKILNVLKNNFFNVSRKGEELCPMRISRLQQYVYFKQMDERIKSEKVRDPISTNFGEISSTSDSLHQWIQQRQCL